MDRQVAIISILSLLMVSCYDSFNSSAPNEFSSQVANTSILHIHNLYAAGTRDLSQDLTVEGMVTANDEYGNFFKSFVIESNGYAIEILDGLYDSYVRHPIGSTIILKLDNLALDRYLGVLRVGLKAPATSSYTLDYMSSEAIVDLYIATTGFGDSPTATTRTIATLNEADAGTLTKINSLKLHTEDGIEREWSGYALFRDENLDSIWCYTSTYADFASQKIPQGEVSLCGILEYGSTDSYTNQFILKLRGTDDCIY